MARKVEIQIVGDDRSLNRALGSASKGAGHLGSAFGSVARIAAGLGTVLAGEKVLEWGKDAVESAAQIQKSMENIRAQFGSASKEVIAFGDHADTAFGISKQTSFSFSSQLGIMARNIGLSHDKAADMTIGLQKLAGSIGMIKGQDPAGLFSKLESALIGNTRGLKQMGIAITPLNEKLEAMRMGFIGPKGTIASLTAAQKAEVIYGIATQHLGKFQQEAAKHGGDFADQMIVLRARLSNLADVIGAKALPVLSNLVGIISKIGKAPNLTVAVKVAFTGIESGVKTIAEGIQHAFEGSTKTFTIKAPTGLVVGRRQDFSKGIVQQIQSGLEHTNWGPIGHQIGESIGKAIKVSSKVMSNLVGSLLDALNANAGTLATIGIVIVGDMFQDLLDPVFWLHHWRLALGVGISALALAAAPEAFAAKLADALPFGDAIIGSLRGLGTRMIGVAKFLGDNFLIGLRGAFPEIEDASVKLGEHVVSPLRSLPGRVKDVIGHMAQLMGQTLGLAVRDAGKDAAKIGSRIVDGLDGFVARVGGVANRIATRVISPLEDLAGRVSAPITSAGRRIVNVLGGFLGRVRAQGVKLGRSIMDGIGNGLDSLVSWLEGKISGIAGGLLDKAKSVLHINSPSKRFAKEVGVPISEGIGYGIVDGAHHVHNALNRVLAGGVNAGRMAGGAAGRGGSIAIDNRIILDGHEMVRWLQNTNKTYKRQNGGRGILD